ncbi:MAG: NUDIX domain-containing protein [Methanomassiliicoccales archaeon]|nr:NUDIX domain-containing protein [Methanomassiliicoccales archaeon]
MARTMKIQAILYNPGATIEYLLLKRPESRDGSWAPLTGHVEKGEQLLDALEREIKEETGIEELSYTLDLRVPYNFSKGDEEIEEHSFGVQVATKEVKLSDEHEAFEWVTYEEAARRLKWPQQKTSLQVLNDMVTSSYD